MRGEQAYHLLSAPALVRYAQTAAEALKLPEAYRKGDPDRPRLRRELPRYVDGCLSSADSDVRAAAATLARRLGRNLGYILLTLHRGDPVNRAARDDWPNAAWAAWRSIRTIWIGGGLVRGRLGERLIAEAQALLQETGYGDHLHVARTPYSVPTTLLGASRYLPAERPVALALDLGQTSAKRAIIEFSKGQIQCVTKLPAIPVTWSWRNDPTAGRDIDAREVLDFVVGAIVEGYNAARAWSATSGPSDDLSDDVAVSIAAYVDGGRLLGNGIYARMMELADDVRPLLSRRVADLIGWRPVLHIIHDGTAAAAVHAGTPQSAVIIVGTALGVGFPPVTAAGLRGIPPNLKIEDV